MKEEFDWYYTLGNIYFLIIGLNFTVILNAISINLIRNLHKIIKGQTI